MGELFILKKLFKLCIVSLALQLPSLWGESLPVAWQEVLSDATGEDFSSSHVIALTTRPSYPYVTY